LLPVQTAQQKSGQPPQYSGPHRHGRHYRKCVVRTGQRLDRVQQGANLVIPLACWDDSPGDALLVLVHDLQKL
jgi:hypothetical protein